MAIKNIIADAVGAYLSQKLINGGLLALSGTEEGRFPKWLSAIVVPRSAVMAEIGDRDFVFDSPLKLTTLGFGIGFAGFLWYAAREMDRAQFSGADQMELDLPKTGKPRIEISWHRFRWTDKEEGAWVADLVGRGIEPGDRMGADTAMAIYDRAVKMAADFAPEGQPPLEIIWMNFVDEDGNIKDSKGNLLHASDFGKEMSEFREPEQPELFKAKRTLTLEMEDIAKSDDPLFACMERRGYKQSEMDRLSDSIARKATIDIFEKKPEKLTSSETKFQDDIQSCIETITKVFGSLEAAGYEDCDCA